MYDKEDPVKQFLSVTLAITLMAMTLTTACSGSTDEKDTATQDTVETAVPETVEETAAETTVEEIAQEVAEKVDEGWYLPPEGFGEFCLSDTDCSAWGLTCYTQGAGDLFAMCTKSCVTQEHCPKPLICGTKGEKNVCKTGAYCDSCELNYHCGIGNRCLTSTSGEKFCAIPCDPEANSCDAGNVCRNTEHGPFCFPIYGSCVGDGKQCSPCSPAHPCTKNFVCLTSYYTKESFCAKYCEGIEDCSENMACANIGEGFACLPSEGGQTLPTCNTHYQALCGGCNADYECATGMYCYTAFDGGGKFCAQECDAAADCKEGWQCKPSYVDTIPSRKLCAPPAGEPCEP